MKIKLLIATSDKSYAEQLSNVLASNYADMFDVSVCSSQERLQALLSDNKYDAALLEPDIAAATSLSSVQLPLMLIDETGVIPGGGYKHINKYRRISTIAGNVMEYYSEVSRDSGGLASDRARITAVWSPAGGCGKTSAAMAFAAHSVLGGRQALYLCLESFSSVSAYFAEDGKSISKAFEKLDKNLGMLLQGIRRQDSGSGISYFCSPENYDDMNVLTAEHVETLLKACAAGTQELVVDLPSHCDARVQKVLELADTVLLVCDTSIASQAKLNQFMNQHNIFASIKDKAVLVNNKGAKVPGEGFGKTINLPLVPGADPTGVYKALSGAGFGI